MTNYLMTINLSVLKQMCGSCWLLRRFANTDFANQKRWFSVANKDFATQKRRFSVANKDLPKSKTRVVCLEQKFTESGTPILYRETETSILCREQKFSESGAPVVCREQIFIESETPVLCRYVFHMSTDGLPVDVKCVVILHPVTLGMGTLPRKQHDFPKGDPKMCDTPQPQATLQQNVKMSVNWHCAPDPSPAT